SEGDVVQALRAAKVEFDVIDDDDRLTDQVVGSLIAGDVVGWFDERFEWGPRSLGHRSILADPRKASMKETVNRKIKFREPFRPFAPAVPLEESRRFFELADPADDLASRFMLVVVPVRPEV